MRIGAALRIDPCAGIAVLEPGAADFRIFLEDHERDASPLQQDRGIQAGDAGADDADGEFGALLGRGRNLPGNSSCPWIQGGFL